MKTKICSCCHRDLPLTSFWRQKAGKFGLLNICKTCYREKYDQGKKQRYREKCLARGVVPRSSRYTSWGGLILRDARCPDCMLYRADCKINFDLTTEELARTCKHFRAKENMAGSPKETIVVCK